MEGWMKKVPWRQPAFPLPPGQVYVCPRVDRKNPLERAVYYGEEARGGGQERECGKRLRHHLENKMRTLKLRDI